MLAKREKTVIILFVSVSILRSSAVINKSLSRIACLLTALVFMLCACSENNNQQENEPADRSVPVVSIGEESVSLAMYTALFDNYLPYMQYSGYDPLESESSLTSYRSWLVDILTDDLVTLYQAKQAGFTLSEEDEQKLAEDSEAEINELYNSFMKLAEQDFADDPSVPVSVNFEGIVNSESEYYTGIAMSWEDYKAHYREQARNAAIVSAYREKVCEEFVPGEDDVADWYDSASRSDKETYTAHPERYKEDEEEYEQSFGVKTGVYPIAYVPSGYYRMRQIVVSPQGELSGEYGEKLKRMDAIKQEYGTLAFEDAASGSSRNSMRMEELLNEYHALKESTDAEYADYVADARAKIGEALECLRDGEDFVDVMLRYTEDERIIGSDGSEGVAAFVEKGELISLEYTSSVDWSSAIKDEFAKLEPGQHSGVFMEGGSYRIIYYEAEEPSGFVPMAQIYDSIEAVCTETARDEQWAALLTEWKKDPALFIDEELLKTVGTDKKEGN